MDRKEKKTSNLNIKAQSIKVNDKKHKGIVLKKTWENLEQSKLVALHPKQVRREYMVVDYIEFVYVTLSNEWMVLLLSIKIEFSWVLNQAKFCHHMPI